MAMMEVADDRGRGDEIPAKRRTVGYQSGEATCQSPPLILVEADRDGQPIGVDWEVRASGPMFVSSMIGIES